MIRMNKMKKWFFVVITGTIIVFHTGWSIPVYSQQINCIIGPTTNLEHEQLLKIGCLAEPDKKLNVWKLSDVWTKHAIEWFYPALYYRKPVTLEPLPDICALSFDKVKANSPDDLTYTFPLRDDVQWDDGTSLTAYDFEFTYNVITELEIPKYMPIYEYVEYIDAIDKYTIKIRLKKCTPQFEESMIYAFVVPKHQFEPMLMKARGTNDPLQTFMEMSIDNPVSAGPFSFSEWKKGSFFKLVTNPYYHGEGRTVNVPGVGKITEGPFYDGILLKFYKDSGEALKGMQQGEIDFLWRYVDPAYVVTLLEDPVITIEKTDSMGFCNIVPKLRKKPFDDLALRQALVYMIDKTFIVDNVLLGFATEAHSVVVPAAGKWYCDEVNKFGHGLSKNERKTIATNILTKAGYIVPDDKYPEGILKLPNGQDMKPFNIFTGSVGYNPQRVMCGLLIQEWWREIGVPVTAKPTPWDKLFCFDWNIFGWNIKSSAYPDYMRNIYHSDQAGPYGMNVIGYQNSEVDKYLEDLVTLCDKEDLIQTSWEAQKLIIEEVACCPLFCTPYMEAHRNDTFEGWFTQMGGIAGDESPTSCLLYLKPAELEETPPEETPPEETPPEETPPEETPPEEHMPCLGSVLLMNIIALGIYMAQKNMKFRG